VVQQPFQGLIERRPRPSQLAPLCSLARRQRLRQHSFRTSHDVGMIREHVLPVPHRRPSGPVGSAPQVNATTAPDRPRLVALTPGVTPGGLEAGVIAAVLQADRAGGSLLDTLASLTAESLQQAPLAPGATSAEVRGVAARIATGLAVALLESDLADRITARLAEEAPFAEGWRSCPE
jgi:hypothetical protein